MPTKRKKMKKTVHSSIICKGPEKKKRKHVSEEYSGLIILVYSFNGTVYRKGNTLGKDIDQREPIQ